MINKIWDSFESAISDMQDGITLMMFSWGTTGGCCNLIKALHEKGIKRLTIITPCITPGAVGAHVLSQEEFPSALLLVNQAKKFITPWPSTTMYHITSPLEQLIKEGKVEVEITSHGTLIERIRAGGSGIGGFYG